MVMSRNKLAPTSSQFLILEKYDSNLGKVFTVDQLIACLKRHFPLVFNLPQDLGE